MSRLFCNFKKKNMAKTKQKVVSEVTLKDPDAVIDLPRLGVRITKDDLTIERYQNLVALSPEFEKYFNVKYKPLENDKVETKG
jgi:hypothetical protein